MFFHNVNSATILQGACDTVSSHRQETKKAAERMRTFPRRLLDNGDCRLYGFYELQRMNNRLLLHKWVRLQKKNQTSLDNLVRDYRQTNNRAVEMMLFPQKTRMQILKHVSEALQYASETLTK